MATCRFDDPPGRWHESVRPALLRRAVWCHCGYCKCRLDGEPAFPCRHRRAGSRLHGPWQSRFGWATSLTLSVGSNLWCPTVWSSPALLRPLHCRGATPKAELRDHIVTLINLTVEHTNQTCRCTVRKILLNDTITEASGGHLTYSHFPYNRGGHSVEKMQ